MFKFEDIVAKNTKKNVLILGGKRLLELRCCCLDSYLVLSQKGKNRLIISFCLVLLNKTKPKKTHRREPAPIIQQKELIV